MRIATWVATLGLVVMAGTAFGQADVIADRRAGLKRMGQHTEAIKPVVDAKGDVKPLEARIDDMIAFYRTLPSRFPPGSGVGDTKALPAIWEDFPRFERANAALLGQLDVLKAAAAKGDVEAFGAAYAVTGRQYCGGCHQPFRAR